MLLSISVYYFIYGRERVGNIEYYGFHLFVLIKASSDILADHLTLVLSFSCPIFILYYTDQPYSIEANVQGYRSNIDA